MIKQITVQELKKLKEENVDFVLLDVREQYEHEICNLGGRLISLNNLPLYLHEFHPNQQIIVHCKGGGRSSRAVEFLDQQGFKHAYNLQGGIMAWAKEIDPGMETY